MNPSDYPEYLLKVFLNEYSKKAIVREQGLTAYQLTGRSGLRFADARDRMQAVDRMRQERWVAPLNARATEPTKSYHRFTLTNKGIEHAERLSWTRGGKGFRLIRDIYVATLEGVTRRIRRL